MNNLPITKSSFKSVYITILAIALALIAGIFIVTRIFIAPSMIQDRLSGIQSVIRSHDYNILLNNTRPLRDELIKSSIIENDSSFDHYLSGDTVGQQRVKEFLKECNFFSSEICLNNSGFIFLEGIQNQQYKYAVFLKGNFLKNPSSLYIWESFTILLIGLSFLLLIMSISNKEELLTKKLSLTAKSVNEMKALFAEEVSFSNENDEFIAIRQGVDDLGNSLKKAISQIKEYKETFARKTRLEQLGLTIGQVSHDLKAPLNETENFLEALPMLLEKTSKNEVNAAITSLLSRVRHGKIALNEALQLTKRVSNPKNEILISSLLNSVNLRAKEQLKFKNLKITIHVNKDFQILGDQKELEIALLNLIDNTCDEKNDAHIDISLSLLPNGYAKILYQDNGHGIPEDRLNIIFDPLVSFKTYGSGIGLSSSKEIVHRHGGSIKANIRAQGAEFEIIFPTAQAEVTNA